jgi:transcriptional regulator with PAS, ATPase and Fis domain
MMINTDIPEWAENIPVAVTVCNREGIIVYMNQRSTETFAGSGGEELLGKSLVDCHPEPARTRLLYLLKKGESNCYTIEKNGKQKMIYQVPWFKEGEYAGLVELSLPLPDKIPHYIRT